MATHRPHSRRCPVISAVVALAFQLGQVLAADPGATPETVVVTNRVTVTNFVFLTITNAIVTNAITGAVTNAKPSDLPPLDWVPPADKFDWIQLKSGEWLKGRIKAMQDRELEFDSEELEDMTYS